MYIIHLLLLFNYLNTPSDNFYLNINIDEFKEVSSCTEVLSSEEYNTMKESIFKVLKDNYNVVDIKVIEEHCERNTI